MTAKAVALGSPRSLSDLWFRLRNRILSSPRFQRWAAAFPLTRPIAQRRAGALFDLCAGFVYSQILQAAVRVGLLEALRDGPRTAAELAPLLSLPVDGAARLLDAATAIALTERRPEGRYGLGIHGASFIGNPAVAAMVEHHALLYRDLADPVALLRGRGADTELHRFWSYSGGEGASSTDRQVAPYSALMARSLDLIAEDVIEAYPLEQHRSLLDVGGGEGAFVEAALARAPHLSVALFDLPAVAARARERLRRLPAASGRANVVGGDVFVDPLPSGADLVSLIRVVHDHDDPEALRILEAARSALAPGGVLLLAEPMAGVRGAEQVGDAYFGFYLLAMGQGRPRTFDELGRLLKQAGFQRVERRSTRRPMLCGLLIAR